MNINDKNGDNQKRVDNLVKRLKEETPYPEYTEEDYVNLAEMMLWHIDDFKNNYNFIKAYDKHFWENREKEK